MKRVMNSPYFDLFQKVEGVDVEDRKQKDSLLKVSRPSQKQRLLLDFDLGHDGTETPLRSEDEKAKETVDGHPTYTHPGSPQQTLSRTLGWR